MNLLNVTPDKSRSATTTIAIKQLIKQALSKLMLLAYLPVLIASVLIVSGCSDPANKVNVPKATHAASPISQQANYVAHSEQGHFTAYLFTHLATSVVNTNSETAAIPIGTFLTWTIELKSAQGEPVYPALLSVSGGMPLHGHGLPSQPQMIQHLGNGRYSIEGIKFNMFGQWVLQFRVQSEQHQDRIEFSFNFAP